MSTFMSLWIKLCKSSSTDTRGLILGKGWWLEFFKSIHLMLYHVWENQTQETHTQAHWLNEWVGDKSHNTDDHTGEQQDQISHGSAYKVIVIYVIAHLNCNDKFN